MSKLDDMESLLRTGKTVFDTVKDEVFFDFAGDVHTTVDKLDYANTTVIRFSYKGVTTNIETPQGAFSDLHVEELYQLCDQAKRHLEQEMLRIYKTKPDLYKPLHGIDPKRIRDILKNSRSL